VLLTSTIRNSLILKWQRESFSAPSPNRKVTGLGAYGWVILVRPAAGTRFYCLLKCVSTGYGTNITACSVGTGSERPGHDSDHSSSMVSRLMHRAIPPVSHIPSWLGAEWSTEKTLPLILCHIPANCGAHQSAGWLVLNLSVGLFYHPSSSWNLRLNAQVVRIVPRLKIPGAVPPSA